MNRPYGEKMKHDTPYLRYGLAMKLDTSCHFGCQTVEYSKQSKSKWLSKALIMICSNGVSNNLAIDTEDGIRCLKIGELKPCATTRRALIAVFISIFSSCSFTPNTFLKHIGSTDERFDCGASNTYSILRDCICICLKSKR